MNQQRLLVKLLPTKQQTLDFGSPNIWQHLSEAQQLVCQAVIADLIYQVADATQNTPNTPVQRNDEDE